MPKLLSEKQISFELLNIHFPVGLQRHNCPCLGEDWNNGYPGNDLYLWIVYVAGISFFVYTLQPKPKITDSPLLR